jgi:hypothetical protein
MNKDHKTRLKWFTDRIGQRIYRDKTTCDCDVCNCVHKEGLIIIDEMHAIYLNDISFEMGIEYRDNQ